PLQEAEGFGVGDLIPGVAALGSAAQQAVQPHEVHVLADDRVGAVQVAGQFLDGGLAEGQAFQNLQSQRVRQHAQGPGDFLQNGQRQSFGQCSTAHDIQSYCCI